MGAATGYHPEALRLFLESLKSCGFDGTTVLLVYPWQLEMLEELKRRSIVPLIVRENPWRFPRAAAERLKNRGRMRALHRLVESIGKGMLPLPSLRFEFLWRFASGFHHISNRRYFEFWKYLKSEGHRYDRVLLTDTRDVVFQKDPFTYPYPTDLALFGENPSVPIGIEPSNAGWIKHLYGIEGLKRLENHQIVCSGTTVGRTSAILGYLALLVDQLYLRTDTTFGQAGFDQGAHIWLYWNGRLPGSTLFQTWNGPVATLHTEAHASFRFDEEGNLLNRDESVVPVVHQFDRHPELIEHFKRRFLKDHK